MVSWAYSDVFQKLSDVGSRMQKHILNNQFPSIKPNMKEILKAIK
jgi:hypothetical protein